MVAVLAPLPSVKVSLAGRELELRALSDRAHIELDGYAQAAMIDAARRSVPDDADGRLWDRVVGLAIRESLAMTWARSNLLRTKAGYARLVWTSVRQGHSITEAEVIDLVERASEAEQRKFNEEFMRLNFQAKRSEDDRQNPR